MPGDPVRNHYQLNLRLVDDLIQKYPQIPVTSQPTAVCSRCAAIRLDHLNGKNTPNGQEYYLHSPSFHALVASAIQKCRMCMILLQRLITATGLGNLTTALRVLDHTRKDRYITLRAVRRPWDEDESDAQETETIRAVEVRIEGWFARIGRGLLPIYALPGTESATRWNVQVNVPTGEKEKWKRIHQWFKQQAELLAGKRMRLPARLIDLGPSFQETEPVRLIETCTLPEPPAAEPYRYIALSYRWGEGNRLLTTKSKYAQHQTAIEMDAIPKTIRDAVQVARRLGARYLWVDALCIIQDDEQDWRIEAARMGDIYMNALCTIAAHAADHADCGFLQESMKREPVVACGGKSLRVIDGSNEISERNKENLVDDENNKGDAGLCVREPIPSFFDYSMELESYEHFVSEVDSSPVEDELERLSLSSELGCKNMDPAARASIPPSSPYFLVSTGAEGRLHIDKTELSSRGWVMQERILSPRTIHFGKAGAMYFETRDQVEHIEVGKESGYRPFPGLRDALGVLDKLQGEQDEAPSLSAIQENLVPFDRRNYLGETVTELKPPDHLVYIGWYELVTRYSGCKLTKSQDKMVAISGIMRKCQQVNKDMYVSGIWLHPDHFHVCLLWLGVGEEPLVRDTETAPSWSWASVLGGIQYTHGLLLLPRLISHIKSEVQLKAVLAGPDIDGHPGIIEGPATLELSNVVMINKEKTGLSFVNFRIANPFDYSIRKYVGLDKPARIWDIHDGAGERIGWASLDTHPVASREAGDAGEVVLASDEGITCFKVAVHDNYKVHSDHDKGYIVMFVVFDPTLRVWKRVGLGQITKRELFDGVEGATIKLG